MSLYQDILVVEQTLTHSALVQTLTSTVSAAATLALTAASNMAQVVTGSTAGQIVKLPDATTLVVGQKYEVYNSATVSLVVQDNSGAGLLTLQPLQLVTLRLLVNGTAAGTWAFNAVDQSMAASDQLYCTYPGTGLSVNYQAGVVYMDGIEYIIAAGAVTVGASITGGFIYVSPTTHTVTSGATLPNNAVAMALFTSSGTAVTSLNDAREDIARNLVWGITSDIIAQTSQSTASGGSLEKYARADHKHAMNINLMKAGVVLNSSFTGNPKTFAVAFTTAFADAAYAINISGVDGRTWVYTSKTAAGFTISAQANQALTGEVSWECMKSGESS